MSGTLISVRIGPVITVSTAEGTRTPARFLIHNALVLGGPSAPDCPDTALFKDFFNITYIRHQPCFSTSVHSLLAVFVRHRRSGDEKEIDAVGLHRANNHIDFSGNRVDPVGINQALIQ